MVFQLLFIFSQLSIEMHHDYCASKWGREHEWTGWVVSEFLTALSRSIRALEEA